MNEFKNLTTQSLADIDHILKPASDENVDPCSPALEILTDFRTARPLMIEQSTSISAARELMKRTHFRQARIGDILSTMQTFGDQHMLVVDREQGCICGIVSSSDIARGLHVPIHITERANSFSDIYRAVRS